MKTPTRVNGCSTRRKGRVKGHPDAIVVVMVRLPQVGRAKTRLGREIGPVRAVSIYRSLTANTLTRIAGHRRMRVVLCVSPDTVCQARLPAWRTIHRRVPQGYGDLGTRMARGLEPHRHGLPRALPMLLVGSDIVGVSPGILAKAMRALRGRKSILAPTPDGGFWLVGLRGLRAYHDPFDGVAWSQSTTYAEAALRLAKVCRSEAATGPQLSDLDTAADLVAAGAAVSRVVLPSRR